MAFTYLVGHFLESFSGHDGQVCQVSRVDSDANGRVAKVVESHGHAGKVQEATPAKNKGAYKKRKIQRYGHGKIDKSCFMT